MTTPEVSYAWAALTSADAWLQRAVARSVSLVAASSDPPTTAASAPAVSPQQLPVSRPVQPGSTRRTLSGGSVLLGLGAICLLVAGTIFITVSWGVLGVAGRALVLVAVTALVGAVGAGVGRRGLRASSEAVWAVFLGLFTLDWFAARDQGLLGLDHIPFGWACTAWAGLVVAGVVPVNRLFRRSIGVELVVPSLAAAVSAWFAGAASAIDLTDRWDAASVFWPAVVATIIVATATVALRTAGLTIGSRVAAAGVVLFTLWACALAVADAVENPSLRELTLEGHGLPLIVVVLVAVAVAIAAPRLRAGAAAVAVIAAGLLLPLPAEEAWSGRGGLLMVSVLVAVLAWLAFAEGGWGLGIRVATMAGVLSLAVGAIPWAARLLASAAAGASGPQTEDLTARLQPDTPEVAPWWLAVVVTVALVGVLVAARRWPGTEPLGEQLVPAAICVTAVGLLAALCVNPPPALVLATSAIAAGGVVVAAVRRAHVAWSYAGAIFVVLAPGVTLTSLPAAVAAWPAAAAVLAVIAYAGKEIWLRAGSGFFSALWGLGTVGVALELIDAADRWIALALVIAGIVGLAVGVLLSQRVVRIAVEAAALVVGLVGIVRGGVETSTAWVSLLFLVAGVGIVVLGLVDRRRPSYRWLGAALLGVSYVLRLAASDVETPEAYTLPFAAALLAAGLWAMRDSDGTSSLRALAPGVTLALLPSLPQALDEPTSLRALLLAFGAATALTVGVVRRWQAPFVGGAAVLALVVMANLGPYALAVPRWTLIAAAGTALLAVGITWEQRVRDGRAVVRYVAAMR